MLVGDVDEMLDADIAAAFFPCGLGHFIGLDTHDVGGYLPGHPPRSDKPAYRKLRTARVLEAGMVITVEPGLYFIQVLLDQALSKPETARFFDAKRTEELRHLGGVRIEDVVVVTETGIDNLTQCPRSIDEVMTGCHACAFLPL